MHSIQSFLPGGGCTSVPCLPPATKNVCPFLPNQQRHQAKVPVNRSTRLCSDVYTDYLAGPSSCTSRPCRVAIQQPYLMHGAFRAGAQQAQNLSHQCRPTPRGLETAPIQECTCCAHQGPWAARTQRARAAVQSKTSCNQWTWLKGTPRRSCCWLSWIAEQAPRPTTLSWHAFPQPE